MTEPPGAVPDQGPISFKVWFPRWETTADGARCRFEATSAGLDELVDGTAECMRQFLADVVAPEPLSPDLKVGEWTVSRYVCPFYSDYPQRDDWEDRLPVAWAVQVEVRGGSLPEPSHWGPYGTYARDETSFDVDTWAAERGRDRVVVAGTAGPGAQTDQLADIPGVTSVDGLPPWDVHWLDLGSLDLPAELARVDAVLTACAERGLHTYWGDAKP